MRLTVKESNHIRDLNVRRLKKDGRTQDFIKSYMRKWAELQRTQEQRYGR